MAAGKSSLARFLSEEFIDSDVYIEETFKIKISDVIKKEGLEKFRSLEEKILPELIQKYPVIATGGGLVESEKNQRLLKNEKNVIYLKADFDILLKRIRKDKKNNRPLAINTNTKELEKLYLKRIKIYEKLAKKIINTNKKSLEELVALIRMS